MLRIQWLCSMRWTNELLMQTLFIVMLSILMLTQLFQALNRLEICRVGIAVYQPCLDILQEGWLADYHTPFRSSRTLWSAF